MCCCGFFLLLQLVFSFTLNKNSFYAHPLTGQSCGYAYAFFFFGLGLSLEHVFFNVYDIWTGVFFILSSFCFFLSRKNFEKYYAYTGELFFIMSLLCVGLYCLFIASSGIDVYIGVEIYGFASYLLVNYCFYSVFTTEAGIKYFVLSSFSSAFMLYGYSLTVLSTGEDLLFSWKYVLRSDIENLNILGMLFFYAGLCFKIAAVPFHLWAADIYEGASTSLDLFILHLPKLPILFLLLKLGLDVSHNWTQIFFDFVCFLSIPVGTFLAMEETKLKRLFVFSGISHTGYALSSIVSQANVSANLALFYMSQYIFSSLFIWTVLTVVEEKKDPLQYNSGFYTSSLRGLGETNFPIAAGMSVQLFSLAGIPPFAGFFAKLFVLVLLIKVKAHFLACLAALNSLASTFYYLNCLKLMFFEVQLNSKRQPQCDKAQAVLLACICWCVCFVFVVVIFSST